MAIDADRGATAGAHMALAMKIAWQWTRRWPGCGDEFASMAGLALVYAMDAFDPGRGVKFGTFATNRVHMEMRKARERYVAPLLRDEPLPPDHDVAATGDPVGHRLEVEDELEHWLAHLPDRDRRVVRMLNLDGLGSDEVAAYFDLSPTRINQINRASIAKLRELARESGTGE